MWLTYFIGFAYIIILFRILLFATSTGSFEDRLGKMKNWFIGLVLFTLSWFLLSKVFKVGNGSLKIANSEFVQEDQNKDKDTTKGVPIIIK